MKVLQVISYGYLAGGAEKSVLLLKEKLLEYGHTVKVVSSDHGVHGAGQRFSTVEFPEIDGPHTSLLSKTIKHLWYIPSYKTIKAVVDEFKPDIVHFHVLGQLSPSALFAIGYSFSNPFCRCRRMTTTSSGAGRSAAPGRSATTRTLRPGNSRSHHAWME